MWNLPLGSSPSFKMGVLVEKRSIFLSLFVFLIYVNKSESKQLLSEESVNYMKKYGYLNYGSNSGELRTEASVAKALKDLQSFAGIKVTGTIDADTQKLLQTPRCGMKDIENPPKKASRAKRYMRQGTYWKNRDLTWRVADYSPDLSASDVRRTLYTVLGKWQAVTNLKFTETSDVNADIIVRFVRGYHDDMYTFDGPGGTLAHAFYPHDNTGLAGDVHFDDDETFTLRTKQGTNFYWVALHELGHSIGLEHSNKRGAVMYPWYQGYKGEDYDLTHDDIVGIQGIYGSPDKPAPPTTSAPKITAVTKASTTTRSTPRPVPCLNKVNAVILGRDKRSYIFNDEFLYILDKNLIIVEGPVLISKYFPGLTRVDTAYKRTDGRIMFFYQDKYWMYWGRRRLQGPTDIKRYGLLSTMSNLDAAFELKPQGKTYFFKKDRYWRYDNSNRKLDFGYPKKIATHWKGIGDNIDAVFQWRNKATYIFKGSKYYRLDKRDLTVLKGYPKEIAGAFSVCRPVAGDLLGQSDSSGSSMKITFLSIIMPLIVLLVGNM